MIMQKTIEIQDIGPVHRLSLPIPSQGGVVVLRSRNGRGKTRSLHAVESLLSNREKPSVRDGALSGKIEGLGVTITVARSSRRAGELEVTSLDGRLSIADLVDPQLKTPEAADARRIKALVTTSGIEPSPDLFYGLFGSRDEFEAVVSSSAVESGDLVLMADKIKRDCEAAARKAESDADHAEGRAKGAIEAAGQVDTEEIHDSEILSMELETAIAAKSKIEEQLDAHQKAMDAAELAKHRLEKANAEYQGPSLAVCQEAEEIAANGVAVANETVRKLEEALAQARADAEQARNKQGAAITARKQAERHEQMICTWREQIEQTIPAKPTEDAVNAAAARVREARTAVERGAVIRAALEKHREAEQHASNALAHRKRAMQLRNIAKGTDEVLSSVVAKAGTPLRVEAGRLVLNTKRGDTYYADLSHGERWKIALDVAIHAVGRGGVIVLQQEAWEGLDPIARQAIVEHVKGSEVVILTAECSADEEVNAEVFS